MAVYFTLPSGLIDQFIDPDMTTEQLAPLNAALGYAMSLEPADGSGPVSRDIAYMYGKPIEAGIPQMTRDEAIAKLPFVGGAPNPLFRVVDAVDKQKDTDPDNRPTFAIGDSPMDLATVGPVIRNEWKKVRYLRTLGALASLGANATGLPLFFQIAEANYGDDVPASLPNSTKQIPVLDANDEPVLDENGEPTFATVAKTWVEWDAVAHKGPWGGFYYVSSAGGTQYSLDLATVAATGLPFVGPVEIQELIAANTASEI